MKCYFAPGPGCHRTSPLYSVTTTQRGSLGSNQDYACQAHVGALAAIALSGPNRVELEVRVRKTTESRTSEVLPVRG